MKIRRFLTKTLIATILFSLMALKLPLASYASTSEITINFYKATLGPIYHKLPDGRKVEVKVEIIYPDTLLYSGRGPYLFPPIKANIYCNWTGWGATILVGVLDRNNYTIDPTTLKPREWSSRLASGGCILGPGSSIYAETSPLLTTSATCSLNLTLTEKLLNMSKSTTYAIATYFFKISVALYDVKTGSVIAGGYVYLYNDPTTPPRAALLLSNYKVVKSDEGVIIVAPSSKNTLKSLEPLLYIIMTLGLFTALATLVFRWKHRASRR